MEFDYSLLGDCTCQSTYSSCPVVSDSKSYFGNGFVKHLEKLEQSKNTKNMILKYKEKKEKRVNKGNWNLGVTVHIPTFSLSNYTLVISEHKF